MQFSGVIVTLSPKRLAPTLEQLTRLPGVEVHHIDPVGSRAVLVLETDSLDGQKDTFQNVQSVPGVVSTDLVYHLPDADLLPENEPEDQPEDEQAAAQNPFPAGGRP